MKISFFLFKFLTKKNTNNAKNQFLVLNKYCTVKSTHLYFTHFKYQGFPQGHLIPGR